MGLGSSRLGSRPSRPPRPGRVKRSLSSLLICGASSSRSATEMEDDSPELLVNSEKRSEPVVDHLRSPKKEHALAPCAGTGLVSSRTENGNGSGPSSESSLVARQDSVPNDVLVKAETSNQGERLHKRKEPVPPSQLSDISKSKGTASTSYEEQSSSDFVSADVNCDTDVVNGVENMMDKDVSQVCAEVMHPSSSCLQELGDSHSYEVSIENHVSEGMTTSNSDSSSGSVVSDSPETSESQEDDTRQETIPSGLALLVPDREGAQRAGSVLQVDVVSISSSILSSSSSDISNREARRNSRRLFWDAFSRRRSRRHNDSQRFVLSTDDPSGLGSHDRWLLDFNGDFFDEGVGGDSGYMGSRFHSMNERRWHSRSEVRERLYGGRERRNPRSNICPSGLHPDGTCSCESLLMVEDTGTTRASISRIVMLAEALFEVLDEIHRQPVSLSLSVVSLPAPEAVVESFPVKYHRKPETTENGDDAPQCYICLGEYEEGDRIRVLPCNHEFHLSCVDKWLKEIHGVCPLCRGDVREGYTECSTSNSECSTSNSEPACA